MYSCQSCPPGENWAIRRIGNTVEKSTGGERRVHLINLVSDWMIYSLQSLFSAGPLFTPSNGLPLHLKRKKKNHHFLFPENELGSVTFTRLFVPEIYGPSKNWATSSPRLANFLPWGLCGMSRWVGSGCASGPEGPAGIDFVVLCHYFTGRNPRSGMRWTSWPRTIRLTRTMAWWR